MSLIEKNIKEFWKLFIIIFALNFNSNAKADETAFYLGLSQPLLFKGYNVEVNYKTDHWVFEYSHGWDLKLHEFKDAMTDDEAKQNLKITLPYTTGGGVGYRVTKEFHVALEYKIHQFNVDSPIDNSFSYTTQTLGVGVYYDWRPFKNSGFSIMPALRYWPTIATTLKGNKKIFTNGEIHESHKFDIAPNVKIGWAF